MASIIRHWHSNNFLDVLGRIGGRETVWLQIGLDGESPDRYQLRRKLADGEWTNLEPKEWDIPRTGDPVPPLSSSNVTDSFFKWYWQRSVEYGVRVRDRVSQDWKDWSSNYRIRF